jgi:hypothetical protein
LDKYLDSNSSSNSSDFFEEEDEDYYNKSLGAADIGGKDPSELIDKPLIDLFRFTAKFVPPNLDYILKNSVEIGEVTRHKTLILDLDETLVHAMINPKEENGDFAFDLEYNTN